MSNKLDISFHVHDERWKSKLRPYTKTVREVLENAVLQTKLKNSKINLEVAIVLANDEFVQKLNSQYRGKDKPTNVLSFPSSHISSELGDIVLAIETIEKEAKEQEKTFRDHSKHLLVHGFLHLLGHDHIETGQARIMENMEIKILKKLNVSNPYL